MSRPLSRALVAAAVIAALAACSGDDDSDPEAGEDTPSATGPSVAVPAGVTLTDPGTTLDLGQPASVIYDAGHRRVSVITVTVSRVLAGSMRKDFQGFALEPKQLQSTPYYATATVRNVGPGQLGRASVPLYGYDSSHTYFPSSPIVGDLDVCHGGPLPATFGPKTSRQTCLVFLVGKGDTLESVELRPYDGFEPIRWTVPPSAQKPSAQKPPAQKPSAQKPSAQKPPASDR